jgi:hypothetical protein
MSRVNIELKIILGGTRRVVINLYKTIFESLKLVKQPLKGKQYLPDCIVTIMLAASL